ncbi:mitochondrial sodium/calcium exchanger protein [Drosophila takahashii]|uniref:mitochondrial sodium/calcium exchanger protein n=1 Tax=Drosophila takahashii TaxID=29030 RepID=UPI0007E7009D|nr:mitochondrial sodium/calcium exchanger protein [Drosophila takahashii]
MSTNASTYTFNNYSNFMENVSCLLVMDLHFTHRCHMAKHISDCRYITYLFNYYVMMYCTFEINNKMTEISVMLLFALIYCIFLCILYKCVNNYLTSTLKIAAQKFRINEYMAGVMLVGVANSTPDLLVNRSPVRDTSLAFNTAMANALTVICLSGGAVCFIRPFRMNGTSVFRDLLFLLLAIELVRLIIADISYKPWVKGALFIGIYPLYLLINIGDVLLQRHTIKKLRKEIEHMRHIPSSHRHDRELADKIILLNGLEEDDEIQIFESKVFHKRSFDAGFFVTPKPLIRHKGVDAETNRTILHSKSNPKNLFLFRDFFHTINPINSEQWAVSGRCSRIALVVTAPVSFMLKLLIPFVDITKAKHGWSKLLNCLQLILTPFVIITLVETSVTDNYKDWYNLPKFTMAFWSLLVTTPLAIIVFLHSRTDIPPFYHMGYCVLTLCVVIILTWICAWEMDVLISIIGIVFKLTPPFMTITFNTMSSAMADFISYLHLAEHGYGKMAFGAIIGGSVFNIVVNIAAELMLAKTFNHHGQKEIFGNEGFTIYLFLVITIITTMWWCLTFDFVARRSAGVFLWCIFILFIIYSTAIEFRWIHGFEDNVHIEVVQITQS